MQGDELNKEDWRVKAIEAYIDAEKHNALALEYHVNHKKKEYKIKVWPVEKEKKEEKKV